MTDTTLRIRLTRLAGRHSSPGSDAAVDAGCTCPIKDNARKRGGPIGEAAEMAGLALPQITNPAPADLGTLGVTEPVLCTGAFVETADLDDLSQSRAETLVEQIVADFGHCLMADGPDFNISAWAREIIAFAGETSAADHVRKTPQSEHETVDDFMGGCVTALVRDAARRVTGGVMTFVDDDIKVLEVLAVRAVRAGLTLDLHPSVAETAREACGRHPLAEPEGRPDAPGSLQKMQKTPADPVVRDSRSTESDAGEGEGEAVAWRITLPDGEEKLFGEMDPEWRQSWRARDCEVEPLYTRPAPARTGEPVFGVTGASNETEALAVALWVHRCPGIVMHDDDLPYYEAAAKAAFDTLDGSAHPIPEQGWRFADAFDGLDQWKARAEDAEAKLEAVREATQALIDSVQADVRQRDCLITIGTLHRVEAVRQALASLDAEKAVE